MTDIQKFLIGALGWPFVLLVLMFMSDTVLAKCVVQQQTVKVGNNVQQQVTETCDDNQKFDLGKVGFSGKLELFRQHPDFPGTFKHNGTICRWFLDTEFVNNDVMGYQGIICKVRNNWTVVDKF